MHDKNYNCFKWHKAWVERDPYGKGYIGFQLCKNLEGENKPDRQGHSQALKSIIIDPREEELKPTLG